MKKSVVLYVLSILTTFTILETTSFFKYGVENLVLSTIFLISAIVFESFGVTMPFLRNMNIFLSGGMTINIISAVLLNPFEASTIASLSLLVSRLNLLKRVHPLKYIFNVSQIGVTTFLTAFYMQKSGFKGYWGILNVTIASLIYIFLNASFIAVALHLSSGERLLKTFKKTLLFPLSNLFLILPATVSILLLYEYIGSLSIPLSLALLLSTQVGNYYRKLYEDTKIENMMILVKSLEERDEYTYGHSQKVAELAEKIAQEFGLPEKHVERIKTAALLHDVGKIGIPDSILKKTGRLSESEFNEIKKHPEIGWELLRSIKRFQKGEALWVKYHHEKIDGTGYPEGLKGDEIPLESKIIAVADVFDALTSDRPYRKAMDQKKAVELMKDMTGTSIDPDIFEVFLKVLEREDEKR